MQTMIKPTSARLATRNAGARRTIMVFHGMSNTTASPNKPWTTVVSRAGIGVPAAKARPPVRAAPTSTTSSARLVRRPARRMRLIDPSRLMIVATIGQERSGRQGWWWAAEPTVQVSQEVAARSAVAAGETPRRA